MKHYADAKMKWQMKQEEARNSPSAKKACVIVVALIALLYSGTLTLLFYKEWSRASELSSSGEY